MKYCSREREAPAELFPAASQRPQAKRVRLFACERPLACERLLACERQVAAAEGSAGALPASPSHDRVTKMLRAVDLVGKVMTLRFFKKPTTDRRAAGH